ncbi:MAG: L,D-transpeptidase [Deltaproteobacteria bacterium]|nr:L,D-transpeptidase [Deltaproteobacteria bacterium]
MTFRLLFGTSLAILGASASLAACTDSTKPEAPPAAPQPKAAAPAAPPTLNNADARDAGAQAAAKDAKDRASPAPPPYDGPYIGALYLQTPVMSDMEWPKEDKKTGEKTGAVRLGYIRQGQKVPVIAEPHVKGNCKEGWYELVQGGFVCGKYASLDLNHPRFKTAPHLPDMVSSLPYQYGYNVANGTPLYRTIPSREERLAIEPWLAPKAKKSRKASEETATADEVDAGAAMALTLASQRSPDPGASAPAEVDAGATPWYLREYDGGKPQVTLDDLKGEGPVARRMVKGFFLSLDKEFGANGSRWWRNVGGLFIPHERVFVYNKGSDFHGVWLDSNDPLNGATATASGDAGAKKEIPDLAKPGSKAQIGIITMYKSHKYIVSSSKKAVTTGDSVSRHSVVRLTGESVTINNATYDETEDGWWMKASEGTKTAPGDPPKGLAPNEKWIDVNVSKNTLVAYEGDKPVFATAVSVGKVDQDKEKDHHTPPGTFRIREKHIAATMDGDVASDGPYSIEDVPWIMYFNGSYALHGAFWHNNFGRNQSHGCVNLAPADAKALFAWAEPKLPEGWHGVMSTPDRPGTRVVVHE